MIIDKYCVETMWDMLKSLIFVNFVKLITTYSFVHTAFLFARYDFNITINIKES